MTVRVEIRIKIFRTYFQILATLKQNICYKWYLVVLCLIKTDFILGFTQMSNHMTPVEGVEGPVWTASPTERRERPAGKNDSPAERDDCGVGRPLHLREKHERLTERVDLLEGLVKKLSTPDGKTEYIYISLYYIGFWIIKRGNVLVFFLQARKKSLTGAQNPYRRTHFTGGRSTCKGFLRSCKRSLISNKIVLRSSLLMGFRSGTYILP